MTVPDLARRRVIAGLAAACVGARTGTAAAASDARIIVVGAGYGGATCARYLRLLSPRARVLLIDARRQFLTGPFTNLVVAGLRTPRSITRSLAQIGRVGRLTVLEDQVTDLDPVARSVTTAAGRRYTADRIVIAPGIALRWDLIEGIDPRNSGVMPHAWLGDSQVPTLKARLAAVPDGGTIVIGAPANPYRCPPGPYERASLMACALKSTGRTRTKIVIADAKDDFSKSALFKLEWDTLYPGTIDWVSRSAGGEIVRVEPEAGKVWLRGAAEPLHADLASIIPAQRAADLAARADLVDESGWCPVDADDFESRRHPGVHVIGDACAAAPIPKSAFAANSEAKLCASAIAAALRGASAPRPQLLNTCYSLVSASAAISVSGFYASTDGKLGIVSEGMSPLSGDAALRAREARQAYAWYDNLALDSFGAPA